MNVLKNRFSGDQSQRLKSNVVGEDQVKELEAQVTAQGDAVRKLKESKAEKAVIKEAVDKLLALKKDLALAQGQDPNEAIGAKGGNSKKGKKK